MAARVIDLTAIPSSREGLYATNNPFLKSGPKGFMEVKVLGNDDLYARIDMPGVPSDAFHCRIDGVRKKLVFFVGEARKETELEESGRTYSGYVGVNCDCCEITAVDPKLKNGVLRMILSRVKVKNAETKCTAIVPPYKGCSGRYQEDNPYVVNGSKKACYNVATKEGGLYTRTDLPDISEEDIDLFAYGNELRFLAQSKKVSEHDKSVRVYLGSWSCSESEISSDGINWDVKDGVLRVILSRPPAPPPPSG